MKDLRACLEDYSLPMLHALAHSQGIKTKNESKTELMDRIMGHILRPDMITMNLAMLSTDERTALDRVVAAGGKIAVHTLAREFGEVHRLGAGRIERLKPWLKPETPTERLYYMGLLYLGFAAIGDYRGQVFFIPPEILSQLPAVSAPPAPFRAEAPASPPVDVCAADPMAPYDTFVLLCAMQRHRTGPHADSSETSYASLPFSGHRDMAEFLEQRLSVPPVADTPAADGNRRLMFLFRLIEKLGLVQESDGSYWQLDMESVRRWLEYSPDKRLLTLQQAWYDDRHWNELWHVPSLHPERTGWHNDPEHARRHILRHIARCTPGKWISLPSFIQAVKEVDPDFQRPDGDYESWYIRDAATGHYLRGFETWEQVEGALITHVISCPARWLGIVDVGYAAGETYPTQPLAFRITGAGAQFLTPPAAAKPAPKSPPTPVVIHPDLTLDVPAGASWWVRFHLERLASFRKLHGDLSARYVLTTGDLIRQLALGTDLERILRFLQQSTGGALPRPVEEQLRAWASKFGRVVLGHHLVLQTASAELLQQLRQNPAVANYIVKVVGPQTALIQPQTETELVAALRKMGHVPKLESDLFTLR